MTKIQKITNFQYLCMYIGEFIAVNERQQEKYAKKTE